MSAVGGSGTLHKVHRIIYDSKAPGVSGRLQRADSGFADVAKMQGGKPEEEDALIAAMKEVGLAQEQFLREQKLKERTTSAPSGKQKGK